MVEPSEASVPMAHHWALQPMGFAVQVWKAEESGPRARARRDLTLAIDRLMAVDAVGPDGKDHASESKARSDWWNQTRSELLAAPTNGTFDEVLGESMKRLDEAFPSEGAPVGRAAFKTASKMVVNQAKGLLQNHPVGHDNWAILGRFADEGVGKVSKVTKWITERKHRAAQERLAELGGGDLATGLAMQKKKMVDRFGFSSLVTEGVGRSLDVESLRLDEVAATLARAAKELGIKESSIGMDGKWAFRVMDRVANIGLSGLGAYVMPKASEPILAVPPGLVDAEFVKHEWTHMLDARLGDVLKEEAKKKYGDSLDPLAKKTLDREIFFSRMPKRLQRLLPEAYEGYWKVAAAAQGVEPFDLAEIESGREKKMEALSKRIEAKLMANPEALLSLTSEQAKELSESTKLSISQVLLSKEGAMEAGRLGADSFDVRQMLDDIKPGAPSQLRYELGQLSESFEKAMGASWRTRADGVELPGMEVLIKGLSAAAGSSEARDIIALSAEFGSHGMPLSAQSKFAQSSRLIDVRKGKEGYMDAPEEMLARSIGRPEALGDRLGVLREAGWALKGYAKSEGNITNGQARVPELGFREQRALAEGFSQMTRAAGLGGAAMSRSWRDAAEAVVVGAPASTRWVVGTAERMDQFGKVMDNFVLNTFLPKRPALKVEARQEAAMAGGPPDAESLKQKENQEPEMSAVKPKALAQVGFGSKLASRRAKVEPESAPKPVAMSMGR